MATIRLESEEPSRLIDATAHSTTTFRGLTGPDRSALYLLAAMTGLRANELASLTLSSFNFQDNPPVWVARRVALFGDVSCETWRDG